MINLKQYNYRNVFETAFFHWWLWSNIVEALKDKSFNFNDYTKTIYNFYIFKQYIYNNLFSRKISKVYCFPCYNACKCDNCIFINIKCDESKSTYKSLVDNFDDKNLKECIKYATIIRDWKIKSDKEYYMDLHFAIYTLNKKIKPNKRNF